LASLAALYAGQEKHGQAIGLLERLRTIDQASEEAHEQMISILLKQGDIAAAHQRYRAYEHLTRQRLGTEPSKSFQQLCQETGTAS